MRIIRQKKTRTQMAGLKPGASIPCSCGAEIKITEEMWQDISRTWEEVDRVYETRWDCPNKSEGVRQAA